MDLFDVLFAKKLSGGGSPFPPVIKRVTGNPIEFEDGADAPLVKCTTAITGSQDLHGYDKPWVGGAGKNKQDITLSNGTYAGVSWTVSDDNVIHIVGTVPSSGVTLNVAVGAIDTTTLAGYRFITSTTGEGSPAMRVMNSVLTSNLQSLYNEALIEDNGSTCKLVIRLTNGVTYDKYVRIMIVAPTETDPTYEPYSNICPITAYTENTVSVGDGTNKNYNTTGIEGYASNYYVDVISAKSFRLYTTANQTYPATKQTLESLGVEAGKKYTLECDVDITTGVAMIGTRLSNNSTEEYSEALSSGGHITFTFTPESAVYLSFFGSVGTSVKCDVTYSNIVLYEGNPRTTHTTTYPSAIYRGSEDCVKGEVVTEWGVVDLGDLEWEAYPNHSNLFRTPLLSNMALVSNGQVAHWICSAYEVERGNVVGADINGTIGMIHQQYIIVCDTRFSSASDFKTEVDGYELVYELATTQTARVTPTNLPIKSLLGYNHIESSTGEMVVDYITDAYQEFVDTTERAIPSTRKSGLKAFDIFQKLDEPKKPEAPAEESKPEEKGTEEGAKR